MMKYKLQNRLGKPHAREESSDVSMLTHWTSLGKREKSISKPTRTPVKVLESFHNKLSPMWDIVLWDTTLWDTLLRVLIP